MEFTLFAIVHFFVVMFSFFYCRNIEKFFIFNFFLLCMLEITYSQGYFCLFSGKEYSYIMVQNYVVLFASAIYFLLNKITLSTKMLIFVLTLLSSFLGSVVMELVIPYDEPVMLSSTDGGWDAYVLGQVGLSAFNLDMREAIAGFRNLIFYVIVVLCYKNITSMDLRYNMLNKLIVFLVPFVFIGYIEYFIKNILSSAKFFYDMSGFIFGAGHSTYDWNVVSTTTEGIYRLQGITREPSHYVVSLFILAVLILLKQKIDYKMGFSINNKYSFLLLLIIPLLFLTGGMTSLWCCFILLLSYLTLKMQRTRFIYTFIKCLSFIACVVGLLVIFIPFVLEYGDSSGLELVSRFSVSLDTLQMMVDNPSVLMMTGMDLSTLARFTSLYVSFSNFLDNPLLGLGGTVMFAHGFTVTMLVRYGLLGVISWYCFITSDCKEQNSYDALFFIIVFAIGGCFMSSVCGFHSQLYIVLIAEFTTLYSVASKSEGKNCPKNIF